LERGFSDINGSARTAFGRELGPNGDIRAVISIFLFIFKKNNAGLERPRCNFLED